MRIGIDCRMATTGEGIGRYVEELVYNLGQLDRANDYFLLVNGKSADINFTPNSRFHNVFTDSEYYSWSEQTHFVWELMKLKLDLIHFTNFNFPVFYPGKFVTTIHDIIHHFYPGKQMSRVFHRLAYRFVINTAVRRATKIISVSEGTKNDIVKTFTANPGKVSVIYEGVNYNFSNTPPQEAIDRVRTKYIIQKPYLLFVGVWRQYKNLPRLAAAFDILKEKYGRDYELVLAGKIDAFYPEIAKDVFLIKHAKDIRALGYVPDADLRMLYSGAKIFVLPSLVEGFGLIGLEAQAAGVPVAASDIPVLREVLGDGAVFFDPESAEDIAGKINQALSSQGLLEELRQKGKTNAQKFDWRETARKTLEVYKNAVRSNT